MKRFAVFGNPIKQSISPIIHQNFAEQAGFDIQYDRLLSTPENFENDALAFLKGSEVKGCNITAPFKEQAYRLVDHLDDSASLAKAVNTIYKNENNALCGANTDGIGLVKDIKRYLPDLTSKRILLLGAGGAARGALYPLLNESVSSIAIANRTFSKAEQLVTEVNAENVIALTLDECNKQFDIVVNCTSAGLSGNLPVMGNLTFNDVALAYDMVYHKEPTPFLLEAQNQGSQR